MGGSWNMSWNNQQELCISGLQTPPEIMELHDILHRATKENALDGILAISCVNPLSGAEAELHVTPESDYIADMLKGRPPNCKFVMPDGRLLTGSDAAMPVASILDGFVDFEARTVRFHLDEVRIVPGSSRR